MLEPPLSDTCELALEPSGYDVHGDSPVSVVVDAGELLCSYSRIPRPGQDGSDNFESCGVVEQSL